MSYPINSTTGQLIIQILDGTADGPSINPGANATDVDLFGKNYSLYGEFLNENFVKLMQNFANDNAPAKPLTGELWYDTANKLLKVYNGTAFIPASPVIISATQPAITVVGSQWWDSVNHQLYMYSATGWTLIGPSYKYPDGISGPVVDTVLDNFGGTHTYTSPMQPAHECDTNCSFVSGHAAMGFYWLSLAWIFKRRYWIFVGLLLGSLVGWGRILQGNHFLSDIVFSFWTVYFSTCVVAACFGLRLIKKDSV